MEDQLVPYEKAIETMEARAEAIRAGTANELVWLLEHPPLYTAGTGASSDLPLSTGFPLHLSGRGGQVTYHGPGQRIAYLMLDLMQRTPDVRAYVAALEDWIVATLAAFNIRGERRDDRVGVWVQRSDKACGHDGAPAEDKIAAIGIRIRRWVTFHGIALNIEPDLTHYDAITPCGVAESHLGVTSFLDLGCTTAMPNVDAVLRKAFEPIFGETISAPAARMP